MNQDKVRSTQYLGAARERIRRRTAALMSRIVFPFILVVTPIALVGSARAVYMRRPDPADDLRNDPVFWMALTIAALFVAGVILVIWLRRTIRNGQT